MHGDHWDDIATDGLAKATPVVTTQAAARALGRKGFTATSDLRPWQEHELSAGDDDAADHLGARRARPGAAGEGAARR